jgi:hypothetical protein
MPLRIGFEDWPGCMIRPFVKVRTRVRAAVPGGGMAAPSFGFIIHATQFSVPINGNNGSFPSEQEAAVSFELRTTLALSKKSQASWEKSEGFSYEVLR